MTARYRVSKYNTTCYNTVRHFVYAKLRRKNTIFYDKRTISEAKQEAKLSLG